MEQTATLKVTDAAMPYPGRIYSAIAKAKKDVDAIGKNRKNAAQGYNFRGIDDAMDAFAPLLADHGLTIVCDAITHLSTEPVESKQGGKGWRVVNNYSFRIYAEDGSFIQGQADGEAIDYGDKCTTKAQSVALREFLFKTFMVPFHTVDDIEEASHEITKTETRPAYKPDIAKAEYTGTHVCTKCKKEVVGPDIFDGKYGKCFKCPHCGQFSKPNPKKPVDDQPKIEDCPL